MKHQNFMVYVLLAITTSIWGLNVVMVKYLSMAFPVLQLGAWRISIAAFCLLIFTYKHWRKVVFKLTMKQWLLLFLIGVSSIFGHQLLLMKGLQMTSGSMGSLILALNPLMTSLIAMTFLGEGFTLKRFIGIGFGFFGVVLVVGQPSEFGLSTLTGDITVFMSMLAYVIGGLLIKEAVKEVDVFTVTSFSHLFGAVLLVFAWIVSGGSENVVTGEPFSYFVMAFSGVVATALCTTWWNNGIKVIGPSKTTLFLNGMPLSSLIFSSIFLNEKIFLVHGVALVFIVVGISIGVSRTKKASMKLPFIMTNRRKKAI
ncbi:MAG: DMT family transporter [Bacillaceae bacterium]|nr:DMT family transporter [Bacillaceae bacterium]